MMIPKDDNLVWLNCSSSRDLAMQEINKDCCAKIVPGTPTMQCTLQYCLLSYAYRSHTIGDEVSKHNTNWCRFDYGAYYNFASDNCSNFDYLEHYYRFTPSLHFLGTYYLLTARLKIRRPRMENTTWYILPGTPVLRSSPSASSWANHRHHTPKNFEYRTLVRVKNCLSRWVLLFVWLVRLNLFNASWERKNTVLLQHFSWILLFSWNDMSTQNLVSNFVL